MHSAPARFLIVIDSGGSMVARLFDERRAPLTEFDASSEEVAVMTVGSSRVDLQACKLEYSIVSPK